MIDINKLKFPIGEFHKTEVITEEVLNQWITDISTFPGKLSKEVGHLTSGQLDTPYRPEGWTIRQVIHHCADSHMNGLIRLKLTLTENEPVIKPYIQDRWAELPDTKTMSIEPSLKILEGVHKRWGILINNLSNEHYRRTFTHPEFDSIFRVDENIGFYAWHCNHHLAHITTAKKTNNWT